MARYLRLLDLLGPLGLELRALSLDERHELRATTTGGMELVIGNSDFIERVQRFIAVYPQHLRPRLGDIERVDLRYASGLAVAFREPQEQEPGSQVAGL
jgi:cell division protein FtsQ